MTDEGLPTAILVVLAREIRADREALDRHAATVEGALAASPWPEASPMLATVAVALHHYYGAVESIFERVARVFEGLPPSSPRWHQELLERMSLELDDVRPAVLRRETANALAHLLGFRHFFRHAYAVAFDPRRLQLAAEDLQRAHGLLCADLDAFGSALATAAVQE